MRQTVIYTQIWAFYVEEEAFHGKQDSMSMSMSRCGPSPILEVDHSPPDFGQHRVNQIITHGLRPGISS